MKLVYWRHASQTLNSRGVNKVWNPSERHQFCTDARTDILTDRWIASFGYNGIGREKHLHYVSSGKLPARIRMRAFIKGCEPCRLLLVILATCLLHSLFTRTGLVWDFQTAINFATSGWEYRYHTHLRFCSFCCFASTSWLFSLRWQRRFRSHLLVVLFLRFVSGASR